MDNEFLSFNEIKTPILHNCYPCLKTWKCLWQKCHKKDLSIPPLPYPSLWTLFPHSRCLKKFLNVKWMNEMNFSSTANGNLLALNIFYVRRQMLYYYCSACKSKRFVDLIFHASSTYISTLTLHGLDSFHMVRQVDQQKRQLVVGHFSKWYFAWGQESMISQGG